MRIWSTAAVTAVVFAAAPAVAGEPYLDGRECGYSATYDMTTDRWVGWVSGGPLVVADLADLGGNPVSATLVCSLQVDAPTAAGPDAVAVSASGTGVVVVPPQPFRVSVSDDQRLYLCLELLVTDADGGTTHYYWDYDYHDGGLTTSDTARCHPGICRTSLPHDCPDGPGPEFDIDFFEGLFEDVAAIVCPALGGDDIYVLDQWIWDCPPYGG